jgi:5-methylthioadenosine/S-adenosylhomocysteine deaminase
MYLASGIAPVVKLLRAGVPVALATDGPGSNNSQDMLETLKFAACGQKVGTLDATALLPEDVLRMACVYGAQAVTLSLGPAPEKAGRAALASDRAPSSGRSPAVARSGDRPQQDGDRSQQSILGQLVPGAKADIILVDLNSPRMQPVWRAASALVYNANGGDVDTVIVDGRVLMQGKRVTCLDEAALLDECRRAAKALLKRAGVSA